MRSVKREDTVRTSVVLPRRHVDLITQQHGSVSSYIAGAVRRALLQDAGTLPPLTAAEEIAAERDQEHTRAAIQADGTHAA